MTYDPQRDGERRRQDGHSVRLALVERSFFEVKEAQTAICRRLAEQDVKLDKGVDAIMDKMDALETKRLVLCTKHTDGLHEIKIEVKTLQNSATFIDRWLLALSVAITSIGSWIFYHGSKKG